MRNGAQMEPLRPRLSFFGLFAALATADCCFIATMRPKLILFDEPTSMLRPELVSDVLDAM